MRTVCGAYVRGEKNGGEKSGKIRADGEEKME